MHAEHAAVADMAEREAGIDLQSCERLMRGGSKSFFAASRVLPARVRMPAIALYAFCRMADDVIDGQGEAASAPHDPAAALAGLYQRLHLIYAGRPQGIDADRAYAAVVARFGIPQALPAALLEGFAWDAAGRGYETIDALHAYGARVAGTVGAMMALIMGTRSAAALARACELGCAMQLTNIARDVGEDARNGRLYLPQVWLREAGLDPEAWLRAPVFDARIGQVVQRLLAEADRLYERAERGIAELPRDCRPAIQAARLVYAEIGREVERRGCDSVSHRAVVTRRRKLALMARAMEAALWPAPRPGAWRSEPPPLQAVAFLVEAAAQAPPLRHRAAPRRLWSPAFDERLDRAIGLFERIEARQREAHCVDGSGAPPRSIFSG